MEDIKAYEEKYRGSDEERADIIQAYLDFEGDMDSIMDSVIFADIDNEPRIREVIQKAIKKKEVPSYDAFVKESKKKRDQRRKRVSNRIHSGGFLFFSVVWRSENVRDILPMTH